MGIITISTIGRIVKDLEFKHSEKTGTIFTGFSLVVNKGFGRNQKPIYFDCVAFGKVAERLQKAKAKKGSQIFVTGDFSTEEFPRKDGTLGSAMKITVFDWSYVSGGQTANENGQTKPQTNPPVQETPAADGNSFTVENLDDEDLPF